ncbi:hypothetical protein BpHYR1_015596 [Brachionus plicatilis]|uniref:Uncharacterized protein n=1 Tax=Brachionus plicatilis TaxID=10195 RepID=A0A3M7PRE2_BRAPC|nr:hypothetical protein BpHYR1_015596 [Brachionus plicatilis]
MDLKQIEIDLSLKLEAGQADGYLDFVQCVTEIKPDLLARLALFFQLVLSFSEMVKFDSDLMYLCLRMKMAADAATVFLKTVLCQRKRSIVLLDQPDEVGMDRFLALVDPSSDLMFYSGLLNAIVDLDVYVDRVRAIEAMVGTVQSADWRGKSKN